ncbi:hypothetical protein SAMN04487957_110149 [Halomonas shengliensis]|uniref:Uncharacterized protein n=1 Tax=Halomonas shengliensis TaxID=419597 RepID=A0A1H0LY65_9GAMM|nr:hypothetical protein [Halomonas shengliensis]SDO73023.1 hypothetical protein SAMN04487957_110149 [Halomonas shengliensis]
MSDWKLYTDAALTTEFNGTLTTVHKTDFSDNPQDFVLYFGNVAGDPGDNQVLELVESTAPGTNYLALSIVDASPGSGHEASEITLAKTAAGLDTATAGASLDLGEDDASIGVIRLLSGVSAAQEVHIRIENAVGQEGTSTELSSAMVEVISRTASTA